MSDLRSELEAAEARVAQLKQAIRHGRCMETGHDWRFIGGCNASCERGDDCGCSVSVHECSKCGDCDYGDNPEAVEIRAACARRAAAS